MLKQIAMFGGALIASAAPVAAQDGSGPVVQRTVEGAQQFLAELARSGTSYMSYSLGMARPTFFNGKRIVYEGDAYKQVEHNVTWEIDRIEAPERCVTRVHLRPRSWKARNPSGASNLGPDPVSFVDIEWSKVEAILPAYFLDNAVPPSVRVGFPTGSLFQKWGLWAQFGYSVPQHMHERAKFAAEFLKDNCAVQSNTGFD